MRVTLTLDDDVHIRLREEAKARGQTMGRIIADAIARAIIEDPEWRAAHERVRKANEGETSA